MPHFKTAFATAFTACVLVAGCADSTVGLSTAAVTPQQSAEAAAAQQRSANCAQLAAQIEALKADGSVGRLEQAASGSTSTVKVKREALARQAELNKAYSDYQAACGLKPPLQSAAAATPAAAVASVQQPAAPTAQQNVVPPSQSLVAPAPPR